MLCWRARLRGEHDYFKQLKASLCCSSLMVWLSRSITNLVKVEEADNVMYKSIAS